MNKKIKTKDNDFMEVTDRRGNNVYLNFTKRMLRGEPYKNEEYEREFLRFMKSKVEKIKEKKND